MKIEVENNASNDLSLELDWLYNCIVYRCELAFNELKLFPQLPDAPNFLESQSTYSQLIRHFELTEKERLILALALAPYFIPERLAGLFNNSSNYSEVVIAMKQTPGNKRWYPTCDTALFLLGGEEPTKRVEVLNDIMEHPLKESGLLEISGVPAYQPFTEGFLYLQQEVILFLAERKTIEEIGGNKHV